MTETTVRKRLASRMEAVKPATTLAIASRAKQMRSEGKDVISFSTGEPDFDTPAVISTAGINAINQGFTHYTDSSGILELREAIAEKFTTENNIPTTPKNVLVSSGGKHSLFNAMLAILDPGDEVIIPAPYWISYPEMVSLLGGKPVCLLTNPEDHYRITPEQLRAAVTPSTKIIVINSPSNPTGMMYTREELLEFGKIAREAGAYIISDELYEKIIYSDIEHFSLGSVSELRDQVITVNGVSKAYAMTGWRIGFMTGPEDVIAAAAAAQSQTTSNPCSISQKAATVALKEGAADIERMREAFRARRTITGSMLREIPGLSFPEPDGAFYYFVDVSAYLGDRFANSGELAEYLLVDHLVALVPGSAFGDDRGIRLSYACSDEDLKKGLGRLAEGFAKIGL